MAQIRFFEEMKDDLLSSTSLTKVDFYDASIIAVCMYLQSFQLFFILFFCFLLLVPEPCSEMFRQLVLSLFITHADCDLNQTGRIVDETIYREYPLRGFWCSDLLRRPASFSLFSE